MNPLPDLRADFAQRGRRLVDERADQTPKLLDILAIDLAIGRVFDLVPSTPLQVQLSEEIRVARVCERRSRRQDAVVVTKRALRTLAVSGNERSCRLPSSIVEELERAVSADATSRRITVRLDRLAPQRGDLVVIRVDLFDHTACEQPIDRAFRSRRHRQGIG